MKAMILAAGHGTRMRPLTNHTPKPLLKVGGKPLIVWHIEKLKKAGFQDIVINIAWLGEKIPKALGDGTKLGVNIFYSDEQEDGALETAGGIIKALPLLSTVLSTTRDEPFLVTNGDVWCDYPYQPQNPLKEGKLAHLILVNNPPHHPQGDFALLQNQVENEGKTKFTFSGIGYYHPYLFNNLEPGKRPLAPLLREAMNKGQVTGELFSGDWRDIGTPERLAELDQDLS
ncbi:MAG: nucleotidyltransferase family protein [Cocleimonas sp.]